MLFPLLLFAALGSCIAQVLVPPYTNLALGRNVEASSTCGEINGQPIKEMFCQIAGSNQYTPLNQYSYSMAEGEMSVLAEMKMEKQSFVQGGQNCDFCQANSTSAHPASNMVDGRSTWWQSPPLSRGMQYNQVNITIDLEQEFHVAYVWIQMANSPRPGSWVLERSVDGGITFTPWQYFAESNAECSRLFGKDTLMPIMEDDSVICSSDYSGIHPMENAEIMINLLENRPGKNNFSHSPVLQNFSRATNVRLRLLRTKTLHGHLMDVHRRNDPTVTRRYFYAIKEIFMGGRCVCNGHADNCFIRDVHRPKTLLCRCEHNTCGDQCERCCPGFEQKSWRRAKEGEEFECEPCNCHGHSEHCTYDVDLERNRQSLDIHGKYEGGGRCHNCRDNTEGINCNKCSFGFYRPQGKLWNDTDVCQPCNCDPSKHTGVCAEETALCECQSRFMGEHCEFCAPGFYSPPECKPCDCSVDGTEGRACLPTDGQCPCKSNYDGVFCQSCAAGFTNLTAGCVACVCDTIGSLDANCSEATGQCTCKTNFAGLTCDSCADGYYGHPNCEYCDCDVSGTEEGVCDKVTGTCLCKPGFAGERCDRCDSKYYGYPNCKACECDVLGTQSLECDTKNGECLCFANFTGRQCDRCAAGYFDYPRCKPCSCVSFGSKGTTCDNVGQCYCKPNFQGERCEQCKTNFYNFPICEACNCNPNGVIASFGGCDKVAPGELCTCRKHVTGRTCDQCKPTYWSLQYYNEDGCIGCECNLNGTMSFLNVCDGVNGQCVCKHHVSGRQCERCADGFYDLRSYSQLGCRPCDCNIGGAVGVSCDIHTGQCRCRPRITGLSCDTPIENHYFPLLWHHKYEAEDALTPEGRPVRLAVDSTQFPDFSWRGFAVFSPIQDEIVLDISVSKATMYRLLLHVMNPTPVNIDAVIVMTPSYANAQDNEQSFKTTFAPSQTPATILVNGKQPLLLNVGRWTMRIKTKQRLFLDYIVLLPAEYYEGTLLKKRVTDPCEARSLSNSTCVDYLYPPVPFAFRYNLEEDRTFDSVDEDGVTTPLDKVPIEFLPSVVGSAAFVRADNRSRKVLAHLEVPETTDYVLLIDYHSFGKTELPLDVEVTADNKTLLRGTAPINYCPFASYCRSVVTVNGDAARVPLQSDTLPMVALTVKPMHEFGLASVSIVKAKDWNTDLLRQVPVCVRKSGECMQQWYPPAANSIVTEAEAGLNENKSISAERLPFEVVNAKDVKVMALDEQASLEMSGVVPGSGHYMFIVHYFNPDNAPFNIEVILQDEQLHQASRSCPRKFEAYLPLSYCPSVFGCRALLRDKERPDVIQFWVEQKFVLYYNATQPVPVYIDSVTAVPYQSFSEALMSPTPLDMSAEFISTCGEDNFKNDPSTVSEYCRKSVFALTSEFNMAALSCDCSSQGSTSFSCDVYGGQCHCRPNIIGRRCDRCAPGYYNFPECIKCKCSINQLCDERTGQCFCPQYVEGKTCDRCVPYAFGYDPLIGCQLCGCHQNGSEGGQLQCDPNNGQCLCKVNVGGRKCDKCLPGFYGFSHCFECACETKGTTEEICDDTSAVCKCKKNVVGESCDTCSPGTFDLQASNPDGCSECFCFGATDRCRSLYLPVAFAGFDEESWKVTDPNGQLSHSEGSIHYHSSVADAPRTVYFLAPLVDGKDYTSSYGLQLSFMVSSQPNERSSRMNAAADVQLVGFNKTLEFWAPEQPADPRNPFRVDVKLLPENFLLLSGETVSRTDLMLVLYDLKQLRVKGSYFEECASATIHEIQLETASDQEGFESSITAASVESCHCPPPYTGPSCQHCAAGYHRVSSGPYLGACVPCDCHGHSGSCDAQTGICYDCHHDTVGEHCELCREGFYGSATSGSPYACLPCPCPHPSATNNFALSCEVSATGYLESCTCKPGYTSERCDRCDVGYFGEPMRLGGVCELCSCHGNNDLTVDGSCHPISGDCYLCLNNTDGRHCELCKQWYYGDAVHAKNCTECSCDQCGSSYCDGSTGRCECQPLVEGPRCDRCVADAWGFSRCQGCDLCDCGIGSQSTQCNPETGQCLCMPGATGMRCEVCEHGFWNYSAEGCRKCDCEADYSMGTVCDVLTGQCHCQEGASGPRCDQCLPTYLRIPTFGCRFCSECVHSLNWDLDTLDLSLGAVQITVGNISKTALTGAHLKRISSKLAAFESLLENFVGPKTDIGIENLAGDVNYRKNAATAVVLRGNRTLALLDDARRKLDSVAERTNKISTETLNHIDEATRAVESLKELAVALGKDSTLVNRQRWIDESKSLLQQMQDTSNSSTDSMDRVMSAHDNISGVLDRLQNRRNTSAHMEERIERLKEKADQLRNSIADYGKFLNGVSSTVATVHSLIERPSASMYELRSAIDGVKNIEGSVSRDTEDAANNAMSIFGKIDAISNLKETIADLLEKVKEATVDVSERSSTGKRRRAAEESKYRDHLQNVEVEAAKFAGMFGDAKREAENAVEAATVYKELLATLKGARELASNASQNSQDAKEFSEGQAAEAKSVKEESARLLRNASETRKAVVNELGGRRNSLRKQIEHLQEQITTQKQRVDGMRAKFDDEDTGDKVDQSLKRAEDAKAKLDETNKAMEDLTPQVDDFVKQTDEAVAVASKLAQDFSAAKNQILQVANLSLPTVEHLAKLQASTSNTTNAIRLCREKINSLKEKIALARDMANRIKLGAHFEKDSRLELPLPQRVTRSASYTNVELFFRTHAQNGLLVFFGNEQGVAGTRAVPTDDYIALEVAGGHARVVLNLGSSPLIITSEANVADGLWRKLSVERIGKAVMLRLSSPNSVVTDEEKKGIVNGHSSVLNLHQQKSRLFVGGVPNGAQISPDVSSRDFVGDVDDLRINGELIGLWNAKMGKSENVLGAEKRPSTSAVADDELSVSFDGQGYLVQKLGAWNPRKQTVFSLNFHTYSPDGLLLYVGNDRDFTALELQDGAVKISFDFGSGVGTLISSSNNYNDGKTHSVYVHRVQRHAKLQVDSDDVVEGESPGTMFELSVADVFYVGGVPSDVTTRSTIVPLRGCIERLKLENDMADLSKSTAAKGVLRGCPSRSVRVISLVSERSTAEITKESVEGDIELTLRFRTERPTGILASVQSDEQDNVLQIKLDNGYLVLNVGAEMKEALRSELSSASDGNWHFISVSKTSSKVRLDIDDVHPSEADISDEHIELSTTPLGSIRFGRVPDSGLYFVGCIGDVTFNGKLLDFAVAIVKEVQLMGCSMGEEVPGTYDPPLEVSTVKPKALEAKNMQLAADENSLKEAKPQKEVDQVPPTSNVRPPNECALLKRPHGQREDSTGIRFGLTPSSRLEFDKPPGSFDKQSVFSVQLRATAFNGIIMFATNERHTDHLAVYLVNGHVSFSYNSGSGQVVLKSNRSIMDDEWHNVRAQREGIAGTLYIDDILEASGKSPVGTDAIDTKPPIYIGGLPTDLVHFANRVLPGTRPVFGGCLREFKLNDKKFDTPAAEVGTVPCSQYTEDGLYFGREGGYVMLSKDLTVGVSFNVELEVRPRTKTGVLLSVGVLEFLTVQFLNGSVKFTVDNGGGPESVTYTPTMDNFLCDGHWHHIKLYKTKNLMTLTIDGKSNLHIMKKSKKTDINTKDPLYLGGVPKGAKPRGLDTVDGFVGCVRVLNMGTRPRKKKNVDLSQTPAFGDVQRNVCPVN